DRQNDAEGTFRRALAQSPGDTSIRAYLAEVLLKRGDTAGAGSLLRETAIGRQSPACLWRSLGLYFAASEDWPSAAACLARAVEMQPWDRSTVYQLALALEKVGNSDDSKIMWQRVEWLVQLKAALFRFVQAPVNRSEVAIASLMQAGETLLLLGRFAEARAFFDHVLAMSSAWP